MRTNSHLLRLTLVFSISCGTAWNQATSSWTVKPEWVRAHEMFLASDAMRGRGSATPDEWTAAIYVASEFEEYGLKPGLTDGSYIQRAELVQPVIKEKARITVPQASRFAPLEEGKEFVLARTSVKASRDRFRRSMRRTRAM